MILSDADRAAFEKEFGSLESGEELMWLGRPGHVRDWDLEQMLVVVVNVIGLFVLSLWEREHLQSPPWHDAQAGLINWIAPFTPLPVAIFCIYMIAPRVYLRRYLRRRMIYAVTSHRVLSNERGLFARHQVIRVSELVREKTKIRSRKDGDGLSDFVLWSQGVRNLRFAGRALGRKFISFEAVQLSPTARAIVSY